MDDPLRLGTLEQELHLDGRVMRYAAATGARGYPVHGQAYLLRYVGEGEISGSLYNLHDPLTGDLQIRNEPGYRFEPLPEAQDG